MPGHQWHPLHGDMPIREMNDDVEPPAAEGEMPTRSMPVAEPPAGQPGNRALSADQEVDAELAMYLERKKSEPSG